MSMDMRKNTENTEERGDAELREALLICGKRVYKRLYDICGDSQAVLEALREAMTELKARAEGIEQGDLLEEKLLDLALKALEKSGHAEASDTDAADADAADADAADADAADAEADDADAADAEAGDPVEMLRSQKLEGETTGADATGADATGADADNTEGSGEKKRGAWAVISLVAAITLIVVALWMLAGLFMRMGLIGKLNLGYEWFNSNIIEWF